RAARRWLAPAGRRCRGGSGSSPLTGGRDCRGQPRSTSVSRHRLPWPAAVDSTSELPVLLASLHRSLGRSGVGTAGSTYGVAPTAATPDEIISEVPTCRR